ncbi:hypothetical protein LRP52_37570 [Photobacterium sp. ZSDE20]|uniref:Uncharacterized protein n=1 Tax=Photobacterium pectinilyticum TaxID=2906793 RepID=A0ABT1N6Z1_9GAMM|nr:hypothetical protein [Photobacterium sp. ZSDE20]MCQ1060505.1 hypothetical protein [Photobacterium sp. ZSDE20]MDD1827899.1 hypothetical protein [Photobacterium sp. ZSDE20]
MFSEQLISDYLSTSIEQFQQDCSKLCAQHYPTVHNRGMRENHLGMALCRRIMATLQQAGLDAHFSQHKNDEQVSQPVFVIDTTEFSIAVIAHRLLSANKACRQGLIKTIADVRTTLAPVKPTYIVVVADHWFDRSKASKEIPAWWLGKLPKNIEEYITDGIKLLSSTNSLAEQLHDGHHMSHGEYHLHHPLKRETNNKTVLKYLLLSAFIPLHK